MTVMAPMNEQELRDMLFTAIDSDFGPVAIRYPRGNATGMPMRKEFKKVQIGKGEVIREGSEVAILSIGVMGNNALKAAALLEESGLSPFIANMRFVKPLDTMLLDEVAARFERIVTIEENTIKGGFGSAVLEYFHEKGYSNKALVIGLPDRFIDHGTPAELHKEVELDPESIARRIKQFVLAESVALS